RIWTAPPRGDRRAETPKLTRIRKNSIGFILSVWWGILASVLGALIVSELFDHLLPVLFADSHRGIWIAIGLGPVVLFAVIATVIVVYLGLEGLSAPDERREWWSRLGAWLGLVGAAWAGVTCISFFAPYAVAAAGLYAGTIGVGWSALTGIGTWLAS